MVQHRFITEPTLMEGVPVEKVMIAEALDVVHSTYLSISLDPNSNGAVLIGGVNIEEKAREQIFQVQCGLKSKKHRRSAFLPGSH